MKLATTHITMGILLLLLFVGAVFLGQWERVGMAFGMFAVYAGVAVGIARARKQEWRGFETSVGSALVLALVFDTLTHPYLALVASAFAAGSVAVLCFGRAQHFINPAALAIVLISLFVPVASWWGVNWGLMPLLVMLAFGGYVAYREKQFPLIASFMLVYAVLLLLFGMKPQLVFLDGAVWFFIFFMLAEPGLGGPLSSRELVWRGVLVAALAAVFMVLPRFWPLRDMDALLLALVVGDVIMRLRFYEKSKISTSAQ